MTSAVVPLTWAIMGLGASRRHHAGCIAQIPRLEPVCGCDSARESQEAFTEQSGLPAHDALNASDAREPVEAADRAGRVVAPFHNRRFDSDFLMVREALDGGELGNVR